MADCGGGGARGVGVEEGGFAAFGGEVEALGGAEGEVCCACDGGTGFGAIHVGREEASWTGLDC